MGAAGSSHHAPELVHDQDVQQTQQAEKRRAFDLTCDSYTPQMYMDDLGRLRQSADGNASPPHASFFDHPLHRAAEGGRADIVQCMLDRGYDKDVLDDKGCTALQQAAMMEHMATTQALLAAGANVNARCQRGWSVLHAAIGLGNMDIARTIIEHGADVNTAGTLGGTILHDAAFLDRVAAVPLLAANVASVDALDGEGFTALQRAVSLGRVDFTKALLVAGADPAFRPDGNGLSSLEAACAVVGDTNVQVVRAIVERGGDVNASNGDGRTALHVAALFDGAEVVDLLLRHGADIEQDYGCSTPLHVAARSNSLAAMLALLKHGASVDKKSAGGDTPLHVAARNAGKLGTAEVVDLLLRRGANENAINSNGLTAADAVGSMVEDHDSVAEDVERVRKLLANAPADRAWRRRGFLVLCRAHYPNGRVQLGHGSSQAHDTSVAKRTRSRKTPSRAEAEWAGVASMLMGVGADPISGMGDGADIIFETIVGYL